MKLRHVDLYLKYPIASVLSYISRHESENWQVTWIVSTVSINTSGQPNILYQEQREYPSKSLRGKKIITDKKEIDIKLWWI